MQEFVKRQIKLFAIIQIICVFLVMSGCAKVERELDFKRSGLITMKLNIALQESLINMTFGSVDDFYENMDSSYENFPDFNIHKIQTEINGSDAYGFSIEGTATEEIAEEVFSLSGITTEIEKSGYFKKNIKITLTSNSIFEENSQSSQLITALVGAAINDSFAVEVPEKVYETNGSVCADNDKRVTWNILDLETGKVRSKELTVSYIDSVAIITTVLIVLFVLLVLIAILAIIIIIIVAVKKKKKKRRKENPIQNDLGEPKNE